MVLVEQLVYGSFPFWDRGYDVLARSPGFRADWAAEVLAACRRFGEAPNGVTPAPALFSIRLASGPRAIVGVEPLGSDDRGRPGALAFHALLIAPRDFRRAGSNPFAFAGAIRHDWSASTTLDALPWTVEPLESTIAKGFRSASPLPLEEGPGVRVAASPEVPEGGRSADPRTPRIVGVLSRGRRLAIESAGPIDDLAREVWARLPESTRRRSSVATWAFGNANRFDLVALPRLAGIELDPSYIDLDQFRANNPSPLPDYRKALAVACLAAVVAAGLAWRGGRSPPPLPEPPPAHPVSPTPTTPATDRTRIATALDRLADRLEIEANGDPVALMTAIADRFRYRGATLDQSALDRLSAEGDPDRNRALAWHGRIVGTFAFESPLPADFATLPLPLQLDRLGRSFHLDPALRPEAIPDALADALTREGPIRPTPLAARYPPLSEYARFLARLPRRP